MRFGISTHLYHEQHLDKGHLAQLAEFGFREIELFATLGHFDYHDERAIDRLAGSTSHQGILAQIAVREYSSLEEILEAARRSQEQPLVVILDGVEDPHNLGAIVRTADAAGAHGVVVRERRAVGLTAGVEKASAGALEYVPVARVANISQRIQELKKEGLWIVGIDQDAAPRFTAVD